MTDIFGHQNIKSFIADNLPPLPSSGQKHCVVYLNSEGQIIFMKGEIVMKQEVQSIMTQILDVSSPLPSKADIDEVFLFYEPK